MLIDIHAHFYTERSARTDWRELNTRRLSVGERMGIDVHVASILGTWGSESPTYFPSPEDVRHANTAMLELQRTYAGVVFGYCVANPNFDASGVGEITRCLDEGMIGIKLAASRRADDALLDPIATLAGVRGVPVLHHVWQHRRRDWPGQEASDAQELVILAERHPETNFILAHLGGGGDWSHSLRAVREVPNVWIDLSGSVVDADMLDAALAVGSDRLVWGSDLTMDTALGKLRYLESLDLDPAELERIRSGNARRIFPPGVFDGNR